MQKPKFCALQKQGVITKLSESFHCNFSHFTCEGVSGVEVGEIP